jgi:hypothetical protein
MFLDDSTLYARVRGRVYVCGADGDARECRGCVKGRRVNPTRAPARQLFAMMKVLP